MPACCQRFRKRPDRAGWNVAKGLGVQREIDKDIDQFERERCVLREALEIDVADKFGKICQIPDLKRSASITDPFRRCLPEVFAKLPGERFTGFLAEAQKPSD
jgi:hypothetical protein